MKNLKIGKKMLLIQVGTWIAFFIAAAITIVSLQTEKKDSISSLDKTIRADYDTNVKNLVVSTVSLIEGVYTKYEAGEYTLEEAKKLAADLVRTLSYGDNGYFWIDTYAGDNVVFLGKDSEGTNRLHLKDSNGFEMIKEIIRVGQEPDGGFTDYMFAKPDTTEAYPKRSYSKAFAPFEWVIGTGNYTDYIDTIVKQRADEVTQAMNQRIWLMAVILFAIAMLLFVLSTLLTRDITHSFRAAIDYFESLAAGDFTSALPKRLLGRRDDIGQLGKKMETMRVSLQSMLTSIVASEQNLSQSILKISENVKMQEEAIQNVSATSEELAASMEETSATTESIQAATEHISMTSKNISDRAQEGALQATSIYQRAEKAKKDTQEGIEKSKQLQNKIGISLEKALEDAKIVGQIELLSSSIMEIANQTNLLALNASIEAARAGEMGKGFAVVADEIGNLAEQSKITVSKIQEVIQKVIHAVENLSKDATQLLGFINTDVMDEFGRFVAVTDAYNQDAVDLDHLISNFSESAEELLASIENVITSMSAINIATGEGAEGVTDIAMRASDLLSLATIIRSMVEEGVGETERLKESVEQFKM